jgi:hypothetical protein
MAFTTAASSDRSDGVVSLQIVGAKVIEPKFDGDRIVGGRIVGGQVIDEKTRRNEARARRVGRQHAYSEAVAVVVLGLTIMVFCLLG